MKQTFNFLAVLILLMASILTFWGCKKSKDDVKTVVGYWEGKYGNGSGTPTLAYYFLFKSDGSVKVYANTADTASATKAQGTYTVSGTTIKTTYKFTSNLTYSTSATVDNSFTSMAGTWGNNANTTDGGLFTLTKK